jgi:hypothetical protein
VLALTALLPGASPSLRSVLVNENNRYSDAQLITFGWFVTIVSAYLACALWNVAIWDGICVAPTTGTATAPGCPPIAIKVPNAIWALAGIVVTTLVGTSLVLAYKAREIGVTNNVTPPQLQPSPPPHKILQRAAPVLSDFVTYDEGEGLQDKPNLATVQQLLFQIAALVIYIVALGRLMVNTKPGDSITVFPDLDPGFLALLGVATGAALVHRALPR